MKNYIRGIWGWAETEEKNKLFKGIVTSRTSTSENNRITVIGPALLPKTTVKLE